MLAEVILQGYIQKGSSVSGCLKMAVGLGVGGGAGGGAGGLSLAPEVARNGGSGLREGEEGCGARRLHHLTAA